MPTRALTVASVERLKPPAQGQCDHFDKGYPGLALRISYGGAKTWVYFYRLHGKQHRMTLGRFPGMELAKARAAWQEARKLQSKGENPARAKPIRPRTFIAVADDWLKRDQAENRSYAEVKRVIDRDVTPLWGDRPIESITRADVLELLDGIEDRGALTLSRRLKAHLHRLFRWSVQRGIIASNPAADLPKRGKSVKRDRKLSDDELAAVWRAADKIGWPFGPAIRLLILTAARREEIGALRWTEIVEANRIELTGARTKSGEPHMIPLCRPARELVRTLPRLKDCDYVFSTTGKTPVSGWSRAKELLDAAVGKERQQGGQEPPSPWRIHDLRRTAATAMQRLKVSLPVVESVLGHVSGSRAGIVGVYQQHTYDDEKRQALEKWGRHVAVLVSEKPADNVVPLRSA
jgi:integrase